MSAFEDERQTELNLKFHFAQRSKHTPTLHLHRHLCFQNVFLPDGGSSEGSKNVALAINGIQYCYFRR